MIESRPWVRRILEPFEHFARTGSLGSVLLLATMMLALIWANSPFGDSYFALWHIEIVLGPSGGPFALSLQHWINDALMVVFFLLVGLEIKRELVAGELASMRQASLPVIAALGGMIVPALIFISLNTGSDTLRGWAIPMATDIAFALGVLHLMGPRCPIGLKIFLTALAIIDDMGAILVIALFYTESLTLPGLYVAALALAALIALNKVGVSHIAPYLLVGVVLWVAILNSGVHATIAGVLLALTIPVRAPLSSKATSARIGQESPLLKLEHTLAPGVNYVILPLFALANAGVSLSGANPPWASSVGLGVFLGLLLGKPIGITLFSWLAVKQRLSMLPDGVNWRMLHGAAWLGGIGFTMALFIAALAFEGTPRLDEAKLSVLLASAAAGIIGRQLVLRPLPGAKGKDPS